MGFNFIVRRERETARGNRRRINEDEPEGGEDE